MSDDTTLRTHIESAWAGTLDEKTAWVGSGTMVDIWPQWEAAPRSAGACTSLESASAEYSNLSLHAQ